MATKGASTRDKAVVIVSDAHYLPFAAVLAWQIATKSGPRDFDIIIANDRPLDLPPVLRDLGVVTAIAPLDLGLADMPRHRLPPICYFRLQLPQMLGDHYRRLLYLDCDILFEGGDISALLDLDLQGAAVGAVKDLPYVCKPKMHARDFIAAGLAQAPYLNSGVLLIDTQAYRDQDIMGRCIATGQKNRSAFSLHDQSALNLVFHGQFTELSPVWNWQMTRSIPMLDHNQPVHFRHFVSGTKPFSADGSGFPARYLETYRDFFRVYMPDALGRLPKFPRTRAFQPRAHLRALYRLMLFRRQYEAYLAQFPDDWTVLPPKRYPGGLDP